MIRERHIVFVFVFVREVDYVMRDSGSAGIAEAFVYMYRNE